MDTQAYLLSLHIVQASSCITSHLFPSLLPFCLILTALGLHLLNKPLALVLGLSSIFLKNIG